MYLPMFLTIWLHVCLSVSVCLAVWLSIYLPIYLAISSTCSGLQYTCAYVRSSLYTCSYLYAQTCPEIVLDICPSMHGTLRTYVQLRFTLLKLTWGGLTHSCNKNIKLLTAADASLNIFYNGTILYKVLLTGFVPNPRPETLDPEPPRVPPAKGLLQVGSSGCNFGN